MTKNVDLNGDGLLDLLAGLQRQAGGLFYALSDGTGQFDFMDQYEIPVLARLSNNGVVQGGDFNGDGQSDVFNANANVSLIAGSPGQIVVIRPPDNELACEPAPCEFKALIADRYSLWLSNATQGSEYLDFSLAPDSHYSIFYDESIPEGQYEDVDVSLGDFNGDGLSDVFWRDDDFREIWFSKGDGTFDKVTDLQGEDGTHTDYLAAVADFNGDGLTDIFWNHEGKDHRRLWLSKGDGTFDVIENFEGFTQGGETNLYNLNSNVGDIIQLLDINGDGKSDILFANKRTDGLLNTDRNLWLSKNEASDLLVKVTSGLGPVTDLVYLPLTDSRVYIKDTDATYPLIDVQSASQVIYQVDADNGAGGIHGVVYHYTGAKGTYDGRGWLGFREVSIEDLDNNIVQTTTYSQTYPLTGMTLSQTKSLNGQVLNSSVNTYEAANLGVDSTRYFIGLASSVVESWDLDGSSVPPTTTTYVYDNYGNATTVTVSTPDGASRVTSNIYVNDTSNWYLGSLTSASVSSTLDMTIPVVTASSVQALDDVYNTDEDQSVVVQPLSNDVGSGLTITNVFQPNNGAVDLSGTDITYTPTADFTGLDSFTYTIEGAAQEGASATVSVNVTPINDVPIALDDVATVFENIEATLTPLDNDSDVDGDTLTITTVSAAANGIVTIAADSLSLLYTSNASYLGAESLTYTISDGNGESATATLVLNVVDQPTPLVLVADSVTLDEDASVSIAPLNNDAGDTLGVTAVTQGAHGAVTISSTTGVNYVPVADYNGVDSFNYTVTDEWGNTAVQTVSVSITAVNDAPVAVADAATTDQDVAFVISPLGNDTDVENDTLSISAVAAPANGTAVIDTGNTTIIYTPSTGYAGSDSFNYTVIDGNGGSALGAITIDITLGNLLIARDSLGNIRAPFTSDNKGRYIKDAHNHRVFEADDRTDACSPVKIRSGVEKIMPGYFLTGNGCEIAFDLSTPIYLLNASGTVQAPFTTSYGISSTTATISSATRYALYKYVGSEDYCNSTAILKAGISFTGTGCELVYNPLETASIEVAEVDEDSSLTVEPLIENPVVGGAITAVTNASKGTVTLLSGTQISYVPDADYVGSDSFDYTVTGGANGDVLGTISIVINPVNDFPTPGEDLVSILPDTVITISVLVNDTDIDGDTLTVTAVSTPAQGTASLNAAGTEITYTPPSAYMGVDGFTYTVDDGNGGSVAGVVQIAVEIASPNLVAINSLGGVVAPFTMIVGNNGNVRILDANSNRIYKSTGAQTLCDLSAEVFPGYGRSGRGCELVIDPTVPVVVQDVSGIIQSPFTTNITGSGIATIRQPLGPTVYHSSGDSDFCNTSATIDAGFSFTGNGCEFVYSP